MIATRFALKEDIDRLNIKQKSKIMKNHHKHCGINFNVFKILAIVLFFFGIVLQSHAGKPIRTTEGKIIIDNNFSFYVNETTLPIFPKPGDTLYISADRTRGLKFQNLVGRKNKPVVIINTGGQVKIDDQTSWGGLTFENCKFVKVTGTGDPDFKYGFRLAAIQSGLAFTELSTDCEAEFIHIYHDGFFGIYAKKDYGGKPPQPAPVFENLWIHDCFIENVTEGMYIGETKTPAMAFRHVKIYNNIVINTGRESVQIANGVEDVEIYNNTLLNAGNNNEIFQNNVLQIGDNTVSLVYNNIFSNAPGYGIISFGMGNNNFQNNYIANTKGVFIDNRTVTVPEFTIVVSENYFKNTSGTEIIKNMNELNPLVIQNNFYDTNINFYNNSSGNNTNYSLSNNVLSVISEINFTDTENNDYSLAENTPAQFLEMGAPGGPIYFGDGNPSTPESYQIILTPLMLVDEVEGGSYWSPEYLIDEQSQTAENNLHPVSNPWKPYWNLNFAPYSFYIDLQDIYHISRVELHDMASTANLEVYYGEPGNWQPLFVEPCNTYNVWKIHDTNIETQYLRFTMTESVYAAVNEVVLYGYNLTGIDQASTKSASLKTETTPFQISNPLKSNRLLIYPNPVNDILMVNIPEDECDNFVLEIYDGKGRLFYAKKYSNQSGNTIKLNAGELGISNGLNILQFIAETGQKKTFKFLKE